MNAGPAELALDLEWAKSRPTSRHRSAPAECDELFEWALSRLEHGFFTGYKRMCPDGVAMLQQCPFLHHTSNRGSPSRLHTLFKSMGIVYSLRHGRWLTPNELLSVMLFPVYGGPWGESCSFARDRMMFNLPPRSRNVMVEQAGNNMNINMIGVAELYVLLVLPPLSSSTKSASETLRAAVKLQVNRLAASACRRR